LASLRKKPAEKALSETSRKYSANTWKEVFVSPTHLDKRFQTAKCHLYM